MKHLFVFLSIFIAISANAADSCEKQIPTSLASLIEKRFKNHRTPLATDNPADYVAWSLREGGSGCLGVTSADFDGDGKKDFLIALTPKTQGDSLVVAALARGATWGVKTIATWVDSRERLYVATSKPGRYRLTEALDGAGPEDTDPLVCRHESAEVGAIESWAVTYCLVGRRWKHVQTSD
jgi:hypothetical protein